MDQLSFGLGQKSVSFGLDGTGLTPKGQSSAHYGFGGFMKAVQTGQENGKVTQESPGANFGQLGRSTKETKNTQNSFIRAFGQGEESLPFLPQVLSPMNNSYEMFRQVLDTGEGKKNIPGTFSRISIKTEQNAFSSSDNTEHAQVAQDYSFMFHNPGIDYTFGVHSNVSPAVIEIKDNEALYEKMNRLSFQPNAHSPLRNSPMINFMNAMGSLGRNCEDIFRNRVRPLKQEAAVSTFAHIKSRKTSHGDTAGPHFGSPVSPISLQQRSSSGSTGTSVSKDSSGRRKWTSYEDDQLRHAVTLNGEKNWKSIATMVPGRNHVQCLQRWKKVLRPGLVKGHWTQDEDDKLIEVVSLGYRNWGEVAAKIEGRTAKQCRERWSCNLDPSIRRDDWTEEEDAKIVAAQNELGNKWSTIAQLLPGRTENAIKTRAKSLQRKEQKKWTEEEDEVIISYKTTQKNEEAEHNEHNNKLLGFSRASAWAKIAEQLPGRSKNAVKKRWKELRETLVKEGKISSASEC